jgi:hypothetical protein
MIEDFLITHKAFCGMYFYFIQNFKDNEGIVEQICSLLDELKMRIGMSLRRRIKDKQS